MISLPQTGRCLCGEIRYELREAPIVAYICHCTDCQKETGSACYVALVCRAEAIEYVSGEPRPWNVTLPDGRPKGALTCPTCTSTLGGGPRPDGLQSLDAGTLDDTSWVRPPAHIWARSAQPWVTLPTDDLRIEQQPTDDEWLEMVRLWQARLEELAPRQS